MVHTIFLIESSNDLVELKKNISKYGDSKIFSLNYFTHKKLVKENIPHEIGEDYLMEEDKKMIDNYAINTTLEWHNNDQIHNSIVFDGTNLASLIQMELLQYFSPIFRSAVIISRIIEKENPQNVVSSSYLNDFVNRLCQSKSVDVVLLDKVEQPSLQFDQINIKYNIGKLPISIVLPRTTYHKIKKTVEKLVNIAFRLNATNVITKKRSILLLDFNPTQYDVFMNELSKLDKSILLLNQRRPAVWNVESLRIIRNSKCKLVNLNSFEKKIKAKIDKELNSTATKIAQLFSNDILMEGVFVINSISLWYSMKDSFSKICNTRFLESVRRLLLLNEFFNQCDISVILEWAEMGHEEQEVLSIAKRKGIPTIMLQHAMYPTSKDLDPFARFLSFFSQPLMSDKQAIWGELTKKYALSHGHKNENLLLTGSPRHDRFFNKVKDIDSKGIILLATTGVSGIATENSTTRAYLKFDDLVREVCRVAKNFPGKQLIVKPHPGPDFVNNVTSLIKEIDPEIPIIYNANLTELIHACDLLITFNNSTIALESIILQKPTISLQIEKWAEESEIVKNDALLSISNIDEIESGMKKILNDDAFKKNLLDNAKKFVDLYMSNQGSASKKLSNILAQY